MAENLTDTVSEEELVRQAVRGDADAFGALYILYSDDIYRYVYFQVGNTTVTEDLTENVFLKAWRAIAGYEEQGLSFSSWLYRIARNVVIDYYRIQRDEVPLSEPVALAGEQDLGPEDLVLKTEEVEELQLAISRLPEEQQQVIILRFFEGMGHEQVGEILGRGKETCRVIQHRALVALSRFLGRTR